MMVLVIACICTVLACLNGAGAIIFALQEELWIASLLATNFSLLSVIIVGRVLG